MNLIEKSKFGNSSSCNVNLVFTNRKRREIIDLKMKEVVKAHEEINKLIELENIRKKKNKNLGKKGLSISKRLFDEQSQDVILFDGMPIVARKTFTNGAIKISNNQTFNITNIKKGIITISDNTSTIEIKQDDFQKYFLVAFSMTIHKSQGSSFNFPYAIHEWEKLDEKLKFVALTRTTDPSFINII